MYRLFARPGWGSVIVEAQLAWYGLPVLLEPVGDLFKDPEARDELSRINPLAQIPTLVLLDGRVMTESAAITLLLAEITGRDDLVPRPEDAMRPDFLRWLIFLVANIYPTFTYADDPARFVSVEAARGSFKDRVTDYTKQLWGQMEAACGAPWFLGARFSAIDIFICAMTFWRPGREWLAGHCPRLSAIASATAEMPPSAAVWRRNFTTA